jgi:hypothetical protein
MKIVINAVHGGFGLSAYGLKALMDRKNLPCYFYKSTYDSNHYNPISVEEANESMFTAFSIPDAKEWKQDWIYFIDEDKFQRNDPDLVAVVEELGTKADGSYAELRVVEIPDDVEWTIHEYDGYEHIAEAHRTWYAED